MHVLSQILKFPNLPWVIMVIISSFTEKKNGLNLKFPKIFSKHFWNIFQSHLIVPSVSK